MATGRVNVGGGGASLNIYSQLTEPAKKEGIWIKDSNPIKSIINDLELFLGGTWSSTITNLPVARQRHGTAVIGTKIYVFGGGNTSGAITAAAYCYDAKTKILTTLPDMPGYKSEMTCNVVGTKIYITSGDPISGSGYCFDTETNKWTTFTGKGLRAAASGVINKKIYVFGGYSTGSAFAESYVYDTENNTWANIAPLPQARRWHKSVAIGTKIYVFGGMYGSTETSTLFCYDTETNTWTTLANLPIPLTYHDVIAVGAFIYIVGGNNSKAVFKYDTINNTYTTLESLPAIRTYFTLDVVENEIYAIGGLVDGTVSTTVITFKLTTKNHPDGTLVLYRINDDKGNLKTELVTPHKPLLGINSRIVSFFDNVYFYKNGNIDDSIEMYYGTGLKWAQFKGA